MRRNSAYTRGASSSMAAWSPPPQARNRRVISAEEAVSMAGTYYIGPAKKTLGAVIVSPGNSRLACGGESEIHLGIAGGYGYSGNRHGGRDMHGGRTDSQFGYRPAG